MISRAATSLLSAAVLGATLTPALKTTTVDQLPIDTPPAAMQAGPTLIDAKPERVGLVAKPDGVTEAVVLVRPVGVADSCRATTCGARRGDLWTSANGPNYVALGEGQTFAENRTAEADQARQDAKAVKPLSKVASYGSTGRVVYASYRPTWGSRRVVNVRQRWFGRRRTISRVRQVTRNVGS